MSVMIREKLLSNGKISLYLDIYYAGRRQYEFLGLHLLPKTQKNKQSNKQILELAEQIRLKRELEIVSTSHGIVSKVKRQIDLYTYFEQTIQIKEQSDGLKNPNHYRNVLRHIKNFTENKVITLAQIDQKFLEGFKAYLAKKVAHNTANVTMQKFKTVLRRAHKEGIIQKNPAEDLQKFNESEKIREYLTAAELVKLSNTPLDQQQVKLAFLFSCYTGLRLSDIKNLKWENVQGGRLTIRQKKTQNANYMSMNQTARNILGKLRDSNIIPLPSQKVFTLPSNTTIGSHIRNWVKCAEINKKITFHCARHTFATLAITQGVDIYIVKELLGHNNIGTTQIYAKIVSEKKQQAVDSFPEIAL